MQDTEKRLEGPERRLKPRIFVRWPAKCFWEGCDPFRAEVVDVSGDGFGLTGPGIAMEAGQTLFVEFDRIGTFECQLIWARGGRFGVKIIDKYAPDYDQLTSVLMAIRSGLTDIGG